MNTRSTTIIFAALLLACAACAQSVELSNDQLTIAFDPDDGYAVSSLVNHAHEVDFIEARPEDNAAQNRSPFRIEVHAPTQTALLTAADAENATHELDGDTLTITWTGVRSEQMPGDLTVVATVRLPEDSAKAYFRCEVSGETTGWLWQVDFPRVLGVRDFADCQMSLPYYWGRLVRKPQSLGRAASLVYPEPASMQWLSYWGVDEDRDPPLAEEEGRNAETGWAPDYSDAAGLYWAAEDGDLYMKRFAWDPTHPGEQMSFHVENIPGFNDWPMPEFTEPVDVAYAMPYDVAVGVFTGDWLTAADIYLEWAEEQDWAQRGPADQWADGMPEPQSDELMRWVPSWFRDIGFWAKYYHEPAKILPEWGAYRKWLGVPVASHWYRYNIARFNDNDPEHLPPDPYVLDGVRAARELGVEPMPYVLATIWDTDTQSWIREDARKSAVENEAGEILPWNIGTNVFAWMCMSQEQWHSKMNEICEKLIWEHGMSGVYLDVLAAGAAKPCYNPDHGHTVHGGNYWGQGARELMEKLRADIRRLDPDACFFSEEIGEHLIDVMDGFLTLDITRNYTPGGEQVWPILGGVYHPHTIVFGSDAHINMEPEEFAVVYGRQLIWGSQPLNSAIVVPDPEEGDPSSEILREYTRAYYVAGQPWLMGGKMLRMAVRPKDAAVGQCGIEMVADEYVVRYSAIQNRTKIWTGPAVMASAWERFGDIGIVMANLTGEEQTVDLTIRGEALGLDGERMVVLWPEVEQLGAASGERTLTLEPWRCAVLCITGDTNTAVARLNELDEMPWELEVVEDGPIPSVGGPAGVLFASSDGPVANEPAEDGGVVATMQQWDENGRMAPMHGRQAEVTGAKAEGHGLPRALDEQPFALIRRLPHTAVATEPGIMVISGDERHLLAVVPGGTEVQFAHEGLAVVSNAQTGEVARGVTDPATDSVTAPDGEMFMVGWTSFDEQEMAGLLQFGDPLIAEMIEPLSDALVLLYEAEGPACFRALAEASRRFAEVAHEFDEMPGALSPVAPLTKLHERLNALLVAQLNTRVMLQAEDRWLAPEVEKPLRVLVQGAGAEAVELMPIGFWRPGNFEASVAEGANMAADTVIYDATVRMDDGFYVERMVPVVAAANVSRGGQSFQVTDILRLEANRPYQVMYDLLNAPTMVAGHESTVEMTVRNWSPLDLTLSIEGSGPEGWTVAPTQDTIEAPALSDTRLTITVRPPADAMRGRQEVRVVTNHASGEDASFIAIQPVSVLDALAPLREIGEWPRPSEDERARIRNSSKFAIYVDEGEEINALVRNIRVTTYEDTLSWSLLSPRMELLDEGSVPVDGEARVTYTADETGAYWLEVIPKRGSADVVFENRPVAEVATAQDTLELFGSEITRYFYVPEGSEGFVLGANDGGPTEGARFVVTSPTGRVALEADGNYNGVELPIDVKAGEAGDIWTLRIEPLQDLALWLAGDVMPYLSTSPERVLVAAGGEG